MYINKDIYCCTVNLTHKNSIYQATLLLCHDFDIFLHFNQLHPLSISENLYLKKLNYSSKKYYEFLNSRNLIKDVLINQYNIKNPSIEKGVFNFPIISGLKDKNISISISSTNSLWSCIIYDSRCPMGIDIEEVSKRKCDNIKKFLNLKKPSELIIDDYKFYTMLWCSIESLSKTLKIGLCNNTKIFKPSQTTVQEGFLVIKYELFPQYSSISLDIGNYVLSLTHPDNCSIEFS